MRIAAKYSHLNGEEYLLVHKPRLWQEVKERVAVEVQFGKYAFVAHDLYC